MKVTAVSATYRKQVSDGNYGAEAAEISLSAEVDDGGTEAANDVAAYLLVEARKLVFAKLDESPSMNVRRALRAAERVA